MLSPGKWHERVPRDRIENIKFRRHILRRCQESEAVRKAVRKACEEDILFYINTFCYIFEPRAMRTYTWSTWKYQDDAIQTILDCIHQQKDLVVTKSRDMGASWMFVAVMEWMWHFKKNCTFLMVSRVAELVDDENPDSLFWKFRFLLKHQPDWLKPKYDDRKFHFGNRDTGSSVNGIATTTGAGVGGRCTAMLVDEFSRIETPKAAELLSGTADTTRCRLFNYTYWGPLSHPSYELAERKDLRQLKMHWTLHPEKAQGLYQYDSEDKRLKILDRDYEFPQDYKFTQDGKLRSPWYDEEESRRNDPQGMALHVDMDIRGYGGSFFSKQTILSLADRHARDPLWEGDLDFDRDLAEPLHLVANPGGKIKLWLIPDSDGLPPKAEYGAGADVSRGSGATPSTFCIGNSETGEKVLEYIDYHIDPIDFASKCVALCKMFKNGWGTGAKFAWEIPGPGQSVSKRVAELGYQRIFRRSDDKKSVYASAASDTMAGWANNRQTMAVLLEHYRAALFEGLLVNRSRQALSECLEFGYDKDGAIKHKAEKSKDPSATGDNHGDVVIADALMWKMMKELGAGTPAARKTEEQENADSMRTLAYRRKMAERHKSFGGGRVERLLRTRNW